MTLLFYYIDRDLTEYGTEGHKSMQMRLLTTFSDRLSLKW